MVFPHASKTMSTLTRLRRQQPPYRITPSNSEDEEDERSTIRSTFDIKLVLADDDVTEQEHQSQEEQQRSDLFTPLTPEEADEEQLAEFFKMLDVDTAFGECVPPRTLTFDNVINNMSDLTCDIDMETEGHSSKRKRVSPGDVSSFSSSFTEIDSLDAIKFRRKQSRSSTCSLSSSFAETDSLDIIKLRRKQKRSSTTSE